MAQSIQTQPYDVITVHQEVEIRYYPPAMKVKVSGPLRNNRNFNELFRYISGDNESREKIAMTTPVYMETQDEVQTMEFVLPKKYKETAPRPSAKGVEVYQSERAYFAAIRYGGYSNESKVLKAKQRLFSVLDKEQIEIMGDILVLSYDAPYKFYNRRNEVMVKVSPQNIDSP